MYVSDVTLSFLPTDSVCGALAVKSVCVWCVFPPGLPQRLSPASQKRENFAALWKYAAALFFKLAAWQSEQREWFRQEVSERNRLIFIVVYNPYILPFIFHMCCVCTLWNLTLAWTKCRCALNTCILCDTSSLISFFFCFFNTCSNTWDTVWTGKKNFVFWPLFSLNTHKTRRCNPGVSRWKTRLVDQGAAASGSEPAVTHGSLQIIDPNCLQPPHISLRLEGDSRGERICRGSSLIIAWCSVVNDGV